MSVTHDGIEFRRLGHGSVRIGTPEQVIYIDPWSELLSGEPTDGDIVFVTHDDRDHYDPAAIDAVLATDGVVAAYEAVDTSALEADVVSLPHDGTQSVGGLEVRTIPAYNDTDGSHVDEDGEPFHAEGEGVGILFTVDGTTVFYPSDTDFLPHHRDVEADVFMPPIGGHFTMDRHEAAEFAKALGPALVLPVHYDTFEAVETDAEAFADELSSAGIAVELF